MLRKYRSFTVIKSIAIEILQAKAVGLKVNIIIGDGMGLRSSKSICEVAMIRLGSQIVWPAARQCNIDMRMCVPKYRRDCKQRYLCYLQEISVVRGE